MRRSSFYNDQAIDLKDLHFQIGTRISYEDVRATIVKEYPYCVLCETDKGFHYCFSKSSLLCGHVRVLEQF